MSTEELFQKLQHPNPHLRTQAMWELVEQRDETTISRLMDILDQEDTTYRRTAVKALGAIGHDTVPPLVDALLNSENVTVRGSAAKALAQVVINHRDIPFPEVGLEGLKTALNDSNSVVNIAAVMALGEVGTPAFEILSEALKATDNVALAVTIANTFGSINDTRGAEVLQSLAKDETIDDYVRQTAISALSRLELVMNNQPPQKT